MLKLVTVYQKSGMIKNPSETELKIPFLGKISFVTNDRIIKAMPLNIKNREELKRLLIHDLARLGYEVNDLSLTELVSIYQDRHNNKD